MADTTEQSNTPAEPVTPTDPAAPQTTLLGGDPPAAAADDKPTGEEPKTGEEPGSEPKPAGEEKPAGAPDKYEFTPPDGVTYDEAVLEPFKAAAKDANLSQESAQKFLDKMAPVVADRQAAQVKAIQDGWLSEAKADKEFGGEQLSANMSIAKKALDVLDPLPAAKQGEAAPTTALRTLLETTGLGNHPEMIRLLYRAGQNLSEDRFVAGTPSPQAAKTTAEVLYPNTK